MSIKQAMSAATEIKNDSKIDKDLKVVATKFFYWLLLSGIRRNTNSFVAVVEG